MKIKFNRKDIQGERDYQNNYYKVLRIKCINAYGGKCACCKESRIEFLSIDHINGNGNILRKKHGRGRKFYMFLQRNKFPDGFRILCHNCNLALGFYGYCPHSRC